MTRPARSTQEHGILAFIYILVGGLKVTYSYQVLGNDLDDVTNDVRDCPGGGPCYVLVHA